MVRISPEGRTISFAMQKSIGPNSCSKSKTIKARGFEPRFFFASKRRILWLFFVKFHEKNSLCTKIFAIFNGEINVLEENGIASLWFLEFPKTKLFGFEETERRIEFRP